jgi:hypothetical protein
MCIPRCCGEDIDLPGEIYPEKEEQLKGVNSMCKTMDWDCVDGCIPKVIPVDSRSILKKCEGCITNQLQNVMGVGPYPCLIEPDELWEMLMRMTIRAYLGIKMAQIQKNNNRCLGFPGNHNVK